MPYGKFNTYEEAALQFQIKLQERSFIQKLPLTVKTDIFDFIQDNLKTRRSYVSENAICELLIAPILMVVSKATDLPLWSHIRFDIDETAGLSGVPDFIIAPASDIGTTFTRPVICVAEAKRDNFNEGWAQALAEMVAAQRFNQDDNIEIFGLVTTGNFWQFGKLKGKILTMDTLALSASENLQKVFDALHWIFIQARQLVTAL